jgi:hypothetical protein
VLQPQLQQRARQCERRECDQCHHKPGIDREPRRLGKIGDRLLKKKSEKQTAHFCTRPNIIGAENIPRPNYGNINLDAISHDADAAKDGVPLKLWPPTSQPPQKSYKDWNASSPDSSWTVIEPGIYSSAPGPTAVGVCRMMGRHAT